MKISGRGRRSARSWRTWVAATRRQSTDQRGIALIAVLWVTLLLGLIAAVFLRETRVEANLARNIVAEAEAEALADAGIHWAMYELLIGNGGGQGAASTLTLGNGSVRVSLEDEGGKIDLNRADDRVLQALFESFDVEPAPSIRLADAVADFRDADHSKRPDGAEDADYAEAGLPFGAKDAPFAMVEELAQVVGMTPDLLDRLAPFVTVHSPRRDVDLETAPPEVLRALPYLSEERVQDLLETRRQRAAGDRMPGPVVTIVADATTASDGHFTRKAIVRRTTSPMQPFEVLEWQRQWQRTSTGGT